MQNYVHSGKQRPIAPPSGSEWRPDLAPIAHLLPKIPKRTGATPHQYQNASAASIHGPVFDGDTVPKLKRDVQKEEWKTRVKNNLTGLKFKKKEFTPKSKQSKENGSGEHGKVFDAYFRRKGNDKTTRTIDYANKRILLGTSKSNANATTTKVKTQRRIRFAEPEATYPTLLIESPRQDGFLNFTTLSTNTVTSCSRFHAHSFNPDNPRDSILEIRGGAPKKLLVFANVSVLPSARRLRRDDVIFAAETTKVYECHPRAIIGSR